MAVLNDLAKILSNYLLHGCFPRNFPNFFRAAKMKGICER